MATPHNISYKPTDGLSYDPDEPKYWEKGALDKEVTRAFELCHGCRMCFKYCDSFPILFDLIDKKHDGDVAKITAAETDRVMDACFQCKLCEVQCPYTPREKHEFHFDFPKLIHRYKAQRAKERGIPLRDRILANPDAAGAMARMSFGMANVMNRVSLHRVFMQAALGIHKDKLLPDFAPTTFEKWADRNGQDPAAAGGGRGRPLPDLLRAEQRAPDRARHPRGDGPQPGQDRLREGPAVLRHAFLGDGRPRVGAPAGGEQPEGPEALRGRGGEGGGPQPHLRDDDAPRVPRAAAGGAAAGGAQARRARPRPLRAPLGDPRPAPLQHRLQVDAGRAGGLPRALPPAGAGDRLQGAGPPPEDPGGAADRSRWSAAATTGRTR